MAGCSQQQLSGDYLLICEVLQQVIVPPAGLQAGITGNQAPHALLRMQAQLAQHIVCYALSVSAGVLETAATAAGIHVLAGEWGTAASDSVLHNTQHSSHHMQTAGTSVC
jgi:hypothetical protein